MTDTTELIIPEVVTANGTTIVITVKRISNGYRASIRPAERELGTTEIGVEELEVISDTEVGALGLLVSTFPDYLGLKIARE